MLIPPSVYLSPHGDYGCSGCNINSDNINMPPSPEKDLGKPEAQKKPESHLPAERAESGGSSATYSSHCIVVTVTGP